MEIEKNDLYDYGMKIYQAKNLFKFSIDSILLAEFVDIRWNSNLIVDFCTGNAAVPLILSTKYKCQIIGFEIQKQVSTLAYNSVLLNNLENQIKIKEILDTDTTIKYNYQGDKLEIVLTKKVDLITPFASSILSDPYKITTKRVLFNEW